MLSWIGIRLARRDVVFPRQFWLLVTGTFVYLVGYDLCFPFETIYLHTHLGISMTTVGLLLGLSVIAGLPMQIVGGAVADRYGRRLVLAIGICASVVLFEGLALAHAFWQVVVVVVLEAAFGWAMYVTANNAMIADLTQQTRRAEAFSINRTALNAGALLGPLGATLLLAVGLSYRWLFALAGAVCALFLWIVANLHETRPARFADGAHESSARAGYRLVLRDRRFLILCLVTLLPLYCLGQFQVTLPVLLKTTRGLSAASWGLLISLYALIGMGFQYLVVRRLRRLPELRAMAAGSAFLGIGLFGAAWAPGGLLTAVFVVVISLGAILLIPISSAIVSAIAPAGLRGRYMGAWTLVWVGGCALGPTFGGLAMDRLGARGAYVVILVVGLAGALAYATLGNRIGVGSGVTSRAVVVGSELDEVVVGPPVARPGMEHGVE